MASIKNLKKDLNNIIGEIIQNINLWQLENSDVDLKKSEKLIDECFDTFDDFIKKIHKKDIENKKKYFKALSFETPGYPTVLIFVIIFCLISISTGPIGGAPFPLISVTFLKINCSYGPWLKFS